MHDGGRGPCCTGPSSPPGSLGQLELHAQTALPAFPQSLEEPTVLTWGINTPTLPLPGLSPDASPCQQPPGDLSQSP